MKIINYDGSLAGLFTVVFDFYGEIFDIKIEAENNQLDFLEKIFIKADESKARRVEKKIRKNISEEFLRQILLNFKSKDANKDDLIARVIKLSLYYGRDYITSSHKYAIRFRENCKNYSSELHTYKGLVRFRQIQEGFLFAEIEPENNILIDLSKHFIKRLPKEKFIIYDRTSKKALISIESNTEIVDIIDLNIEETEEEKFFQDLWVKFYDTISIKERANKKLMISNMPKKYWKYLPEKNKGLLQNE